MNRLDVKETMNQIHISQEMQEEIIRNVHDRIKNGKGKPKNWGRMAAAAATLLFAAGVLSIPVQAVVKDIVKARMEHIPKEEVRATADLIQEQELAADRFSREYSTEEKERMKKLEEIYQGGTFPEKTISQADTIEDAPEGMLSYIKDTGDFFLPARELTDEELLEIIDFNHGRDYALEQNPAAQDAREELQTEQARLREQVQAAGGISEAKAVEIAWNQLKSELGASAETKEFLHTFLIDRAKTEYDYDTEVMYLISFGDLNDKSTYSCEIDSADGTVLNTHENKPSE